MDIFADVLPLLLVLLTIGAIAGFLAGLLGIGGGVVLVPGLYYSLGSLGYDPAVLMHIAVGTSLAVIVPTGLSSAMSHWRKGAVRLDLVKKIGLGILFGVAAGTFIAAELSGDALKAIFACILFVLAILMVFRPSTREARLSLMHQPAAGIGGTVIGAVSAMMGIGGATLSVPFMSFGGVGIHKAVGTAAALGLVISIPATLGFMLIGSDAENMPPWSIGYVNALAWLIIVPVSVVMAPLGARLAHAVSVTRLRTGFAVFIMLVSLRMLYGVFYG